MSRIGKTFAGLDRPAFIAYLVAGDPDPGGFATAARAVTDGGADILEVGMPFSDPVADGPIIQRAHIRALDDGMTVNRYFDLVREFRGSSGIPLVLMVYYNTVHRRGVDRFYHEAAAAGADGVIVGSAIVKIVEEHSADPERMAREIRGFIAGMRETLGS